MDGAAGALKAREKALRGSWVAPALLGDLLHLVPRAVAATDKPKPQPGVRCHCPRCGERTFLRLVMAALQCPRCREVVSIREVPGAA